MDLPTSIEEIAYWGLIGEVIEATMTSLIIIIIIECKCDYPGADPQIILPVSVRIIDKVACVAGGILGGWLFTNFILEEPSTVVTGIGAVLGSLVSLEISFYTIGLKILRTPKSG